MYNYEERLFNDNWYFCLDDKNISSDADCDFSNWEKVELPHDWQISGAYDEDAPTGFSGGYQHAGIGWYKKEFSKAECTGSKTLLDFDGIYKDATIWLNGKVITTHYYGYTNFHIDITNSIQDKNIITIKVDNSQQPDSRWYCGSGIYRNVRLINSDSVCVRRDSVFVSSTHNEKEVILKVELIIENDFKALFQGDIKCKVEEIELYKKVTIAANDSQAISLSAKLENPRLWSDDDPQMYEMKVSINENIDQTVKFGIRDIRFDANEGFFLNGKRTQLNGVCLHHDGGSVGAAVPIEIWVRRLNDLKEMGVNSIRISHNPPSRELLDLCDEMGILVMDEIFDEWQLSKNKSGSNEYGYAYHFKENYIKDTIAMLRRDRNHPSIIMWSIGNEIPEQVGDGLDGEKLISEYFTNGSSGDTNGLELQKQLIDICKKEDPYRPITSACDLIEAEPLSASNEFLHELDIVGYNYPDRWRKRRETSYGEDRFNHPDWCMIGAEISSISMSRGEYSQNQGDTTGIRTNYYNSMLEVERLMKYVKTHPHVAGDYMWTGIDYLGESMWPNKNSSCGVLDTAGFRKDSFYFYQSQWTSKDVVHIMPHWNMEGSQGKIIPVICYTNCEKVELFLNGKSYGVRAYEFPRQGMAQKYGHYDKPVISITTNDLHLSWDVPYEEGVLEAVGYNGDTEVKRATVKTTGDPYKLIVTIDEGLIKNQEVYHAIVTVVDKGGLIVPVASNKINIDVKGGIVLGVDNGDPSSHELFKASSRLAKAGLCLAIVKKTDSKMKIVANSEGLIGDSIDLIS